MSLNNTLRKIKNNFSFTGLLKSTSITLKYIAIFVQRSEYWERKSIPKQKICFVSGVLCPLQKGLCNEWAGRWHHDVSVPLCPKLVNKLIVKQISWMVTFSSPENSTQQHTVIHFQCPRISSFTTYLWKINEIKLRQVALLGLNNFDVNVDNEWITDNLTKSWKSETKLKLLFLWQLSKHVASTIHPYILSFTWVYPIITFSNRSWCKGKTGPQIGT